MTWKWLISSTGLLVPELMHRKIPFVLSVLVKVQASNSSLVLLLLQPTTNILQGKIFVWPATWAQDDAQMILWAGEVL